MNWFVPKCPVEAEDKAWIEESFLWLIEEFGVDTLRNAPVILPTNEFFPDEFNGDEEDVRAMVDRVCAYMDVDPDQVELKIFVDPNAQAGRGLPIFESSHGGPAGHYTKRQDKFRISLESSQLGDPTSLIATIAHELGHVRLLGEDRLDPDFEEHEPLTDLLTVFLGLGVFTGNSVFSFTQWSDGFSEGWQTQRRGYLTEEMFGYALAALAWMRSEAKPLWAKHLEGNVSAYFKSGQKYLEKTGDTILKRL
ncbi:MAG TPA: hypothetical protein VJU86_10585 [Pyrinomonadaceae bacterium]|nr:hypothetical protein [Pyrinomonadaceae bacterium]